MRALIHRAGGKGPSSGGVCFNQFEDFYRLAFLELRDAQRSWDLLPAEPWVFPGRFALLLPLRSLGSFSAAVWEEKRDLWLSFWELKRVEILPAKSENPCRSSMKSRLH